MSNDICNNADFNCEHRRYRGGRQGWHCNKYNKILRWHENESIKQGGYISRKCAACRKEREK